MRPVHFIETLPLEIEELLSDPSVAREVLESAVASSPDATTFEIIAFCANDSDGCTMGTVGLIIIDKSGLEEQKGRPVLELSEGMRALFAKLG